MTWKDKWVLLPPPAPKSHLKTNYVSPSKGVLVFKSCLNCHKEFKPKNKPQKFCSQSCSAYANQVGKPSHHAKGEQEGNTVCPQCGQAITTNKRIFCSKKCCTESNKVAAEEAIRLWVSGGPSPFLSQTLVSRTVRQLRGTPCEVCGWDCVNPKSGLVPTQVDHTDGNALNNAYSNLQVLCPNCHALTATYGYLNKGSGVRPKRHTVKPLGARNQFSK